MTDKIRLQIDLALVDLDEAPAPGAMVRRELLEPAPSFPGADRDRPTLLAPERARSPRFDARTPFGS